jgi:hypothetical protein
MNNGTRRISLLGTEAFINKAGVKSLFGSSHLFAQTIPVQILMSRGNA